MEQVYIHFKQSMFEGKRDTFSKGLSGEDKMSRRIHPVEAYIPIPKEALPPVAETYFDIAKQKGFVREGNPILYLTANDTTEIKDNGERLKTYNIVLHWPAHCGLLEKRSLNKGLIRLRFDYFTKSTDYETFEALKESCRINDLHRSSNYNTIDILKMIKNAPWNAGLNILVKRLLHDSTLPLGFLDVINRKYEVFQGAVPNPERKSSLCEEAALEFKFGNDLTLNHTDGSGNLYPSGMYGGLVTPNTFDESNPVIRKPLVWNIINDNDILNSIEGVSGYDGTILMYFNGKIPLHSDLEGKSLESFVSEVLPNIIDSMDEFVEN